jgi:hypothetical protein
MSTGPDEAARTARENFLARWSRLKRATGPADQAPEAATPEAQPAGIPEAAPPDLPELPSLESLTADSDFSVFLHPRVPAGLRAQALARAWSLDPFIRDFKEMADYAWDWNTPGGAPGYGPLDAAGDVAQMLARILPDPPAAPETRTAEPPPEPTPLPEITPPPEAMPADPVRIADAAVQQVAASSRQTASEAEAAYDDDAPALQPAMRPRRHGGALPS